MKKLIPVFTCLIILSCTSKKKVKNDWVSENIKGNVKSVTYHIYKTIKKTGVIEKNSLIYIDSTIFNNAGFLLRDLSMRHDTIAFERICKYDAHNNLIEKEVYNEGRLVLHEINKYDDNGNRIEQITFEPKGRSSLNSLEKSDIHYTYKNVVDGKIIESSATEDGKPWYSSIQVLDGNWNVIKQKMLYSWDTSINITLYQYNVQGEMTEQKCFDDDSVLDFRFVNKYDAQGNKIEEVAYRRGDTIEFRKVVTFDDKENTISEIYYKGDGSINSDARHEFKKFDEMGNWLEQVFYNKSKPATITERTIEYF